MHIMTTLVCLFGICVFTANAYIRNPGPRVAPTVGEIWPKPQSQLMVDDSHLAISSNGFYFKVIGETCYILESALIRYRLIISKIVESDLKIQSLKDVHPNLIPPTIVDSISVNLSLPCEDAPYLEMDESYELSVSERRIYSKTVWGILRGLETFSQILTPYNNNTLRIPNTEIHDFPRFAHRGLLVDTSRHFMKINTLLKILDGMSYNKLNVFHWHIVDDESFPYESKSFPELAKQGSYAPGMTYSQEDIARLIEYARLRGIRVIAEFDVPGHTRSWGIAHPEILTKCGFPYEGMLGPMNPIDNSTFKFVNEFLKEALDVFPDKFIHLGGDEVGYECWQTNKDIVRYITENNVSYETLQKKFSQRVANMANTENKTSIFWQEAMINNDNIPKTSVVQVWLGNWKRLVKKFIAKGHRVLLSACWYLDHLSNGGDWLKFYNCEPHDFNGTEDENKMMLGGEACMWSEVVNDRNVLERIFPRVSAAAERLWSQRSITDTSDAASRLEEHTCRMVNRGIPAQPPNGAGFC